MLERKGGAAIGLRSGASGNGLPRPRAKRRQMSPAGLPVFACLIQGDCPLDAHESRLGTPAWRRCCVRLVFRSGTNVPSAPLSGLHMAGDPVFYSFETVAAGTWFYDGTVPKRIEIVAVPARFAASRYNDDDELDDAALVPETDDGFLYRFRGAVGGEFRSVKAAQAWADAQPWGPVTWDRTSDG